MLCHVLDGTRKEWTVWALLLLLAALLVSIPAWMPGHTFAGHDLIFHLYRIEGLKDGLLAGHCPVRMNNVWFQGYGMPTGIFYPDLFLYIPALLRMVRLPLMTVWQIFLVLVNIATAFASWWAFSSYLHSKRAGAIATLFYLVFLYRWRISSCLSCPSAAFACVSSGGRSSWR